MPIVGGIEKDNILMRVLTNIIIKLQKLEEASMHATETTRI
jgi:hypothetical protein